MADDEMLDDILAAEHAIRLRIDALAEQLAARRETLRQELAQLLADESARLEAEMAMACSRTAATAAQEAEAQLGAAQASAQRLAALTIPELDRVVLRHLGQIFPKGADDRQDEQA